MPRAIEVCTLVKEIRFAAKDGIAMGKVRRDVKRLLVVIRKKGPRPPFEGGGVPPDIHDHIEDLP
jgi:hypothetical protein